MEKRYVIGIDQSTQGTKAILTDERGRILSRCDLAHEQILNEKGWVSHDPETLYANTVSAAVFAVQSAGVPAEEIAAVGITNQRETTVAWDRQTGRSAAPAVVWQCSRAEEVSAPYEGTEFAAYVREKTGIPFSAYFPAAKGAWLLRHEPRVRELADEGRLCLGTVDAWLVNRLTGGKTFATDYSNASRTQLFDLQALKWDGEICRELGIPAAALPEVRDSDADYGTTDLEGFLPHPVPIRSVMGDSHAAFYAQNCTEPGMAKATYGTGSSVMMQIGPEFRESRHGLVTSLAWGIGGRVDYVLEGNIHYSGAVVTWLKELGLIGSASETNTLPFEANPDDTTYLVPAFTGLGAPYWSASARAAFLGMSRTTGKPELVKAALESIAYQVTGVLEAMQEDAGIRLSELRVDGGATANPYLMQFQSDIAGVRIRVPGEEALSALGTAQLAARSAGILPGPAGPEVRKIYMPEMEVSRREYLYEGWKKAVKKVTEEER